MSQIFVRSAFIPSYVRCPFLLVALLQVAFLLGPFLLGPSTVVAENTFTKLVLAGATAQIGVTVGYDGSYQKLKFPGGDVDRTTGVCTDVLIRAYRNAGVDLQELVHKDMNAHFSKYPNLWGLSRPDSNIDHRRVPNLMTFFGRHGTSLPLPSDNDPKPFQPGDIVAWQLDNGLPHIGIVSDTRTRDGNRYQVIHNIGQGTRREDVLFLFKLRGHYRYNPTSRSEN